jgi:hypothetical protein
MRKFIVLLIFLLIASLTYLGYAHFSGGAVPTFGLPIGGEKALIRARTLAFFEHVRFKNASAFKDFVAKDVSEQQLARFMEKDLGFDAAQFDLLSVTIEKIEVDSQGLRSRVQVSLNGTDLATERQLHLSKVLFFYRADDGRWLIDTTTSV